MKNKLSLVRKIIAIVFSCIFLATFPITVLAVSLIDVSSTSEHVSIWGFTYDKKDLTYKNIHDAAGNTFVLIEVDPTGYFIYDPISMQYLEGSPESPSPYLGYNCDLYYLGPQQYYRINNSTYCHTLLPTVHSLSSAEFFNAQAIFSSALADIREPQITTSVIEEKTAEVNGAYDNMIAVDYDGYTAYFVQNYGHIINAQYPRNTDGTCGYISACILLYYWHKRIGNIVPDNYLSNGYLKTNGQTSADNLKLKLITYSDGGSSWALEIADVLSAYCQEFGISANVSYELLNIGTNTQLKANRPVILFGSFPSLTSNESIMHAVVAYGFHVPDDNPSGGYYVHYGWYNYPKVILNSGLVGNVTEFKPSNT